MEALREQASRDGVQVKLRPGVYTLDEAASARFIPFTGRGSTYDLQGVTLRVDTRLFSRFGVPTGPEGFYCVLDITGAHTEVRGVRIETFGNLPGIQSKNKLINVAAPGVTLRDVELTTAGSAPWGYGSLFGISGGAVRKMNGIRVGWPAVGARLLGCRVHMRAMGHAIFVQGAQETVIEDCHVDGLLRATDSILQEAAGLAFERGFIASGPHYVEGVRVGPDGRILPGEMVSLSEDGIRLYPGHQGHPTGPTLIRGCTVRQMRRGICTGLGPAADRIVGCEVVDCVATAYNVGSADTVESSRGNARFGEALSCPYGHSAGAQVELEILDSRGGLANDTLAVINGRDHKIRLWTRDPEFLAGTWVIATGSRRGYAFYQAQPGPAARLQLDNATPATVSTAEELPRR